MTNNLTRCVEPCHQSRPSVASARVSGFSGQFPIRKAIIPKFAEEASGFSGLPPSEFRKEPWYRKHLFPLDSRGRFGANVVHDAIDAADFVDDSVGDPAEYVMRKFVPVRGHAVRARHRS